MSGWGFSSLFSGVRSQRRQDDTHELPPPPPADAGKRRLHFRARSNEGSKWTLSRANDGRLSTGSPMAGLARAGSVSAADNAKTPSVEEVAAEVAAPAANAQAETPAAVTKVAAEVAAPVAEAGAETEGAAEVSAPPQLLSIAKNF